VFISIEVVAVFQVMIPRAPFICRVATGPLRAVDGDIVTIHWSCINENGEVLESSTASDEPTTFEVGAGYIVDNRLFEAFDEAVRGLEMGDTVSIKVRRHRLKIYKLAGWTFFMCSQCDQCSPIV
jgi:hypothetical protein